MPINDATTHFKFMHLEGSDLASHNSINALITDIDDELYQRVAVPGMITVWNSVVTVPDGWTNLGNTPTGLPALVLPYVWIEKAA
jgi:hypothetical protein